jgi:hypothetical protein
VPWYYVGTRLGTRFEIAESLDIYGIEEVVPMVLSKFRLKFVLQNKTVFLKNVSNNLKKVVPLVPLVPPTVSV